MLLRSQGGPGQEWFRFGVLEPDILGRFFRAPRCCRMGSQEGGLMKHDDERGMASGDSMARGGDGETSVLEKAVYPTLVHTAVTDAMDTRLLQIECGFTRGFAGMQLIGNASEVCRDGKERARAALEQLGLHLPPRRLVVSLTPADVKKDGSHLDLPIAVS